MMVRHNGGIVIGGIRRLFMRLVFGILALSLALVPISASAHGEGAKKECHQHDTRAPHCH